MARVLLNRPYESETKEYGVWRSAIQRCTNPNNNAYKNYGERGIIMCDHWRYSFKQFISDMGLCPEGLTIERKNNDLGYLCPLCCPPIGNCEWASRKKQLANRRQIRWKPEKVYKKRGDKIRAWWAKQTPEYKRSITAAGAAGAADRLMKWNQDNKNTECLRCGHKWAKKSKKRSTMCPKCHTAKWDVPLPSEQPTVV